MSRYMSFWLIFYKTLSFSLLTYAGCPRTIPHEIEGKCYRFQIERLQFKDAQDACMKLESGAMIMTVKTETTLKEIEKIVYDYVTTNLEKALFWIGFSMDDSDATKALEDRYWKWDYDESRIVQKDYALWEEPGGPSDKTLVCATIDASNDYLVKPVDCGAPVLPVICRMKENRTCKDDFNPYLMYGDYCLASLNGVFEYNKIHGACNPSTPAIYTEETREYVINAAKNYFLGGGMFVNLARYGSIFYDRTDGTVPPNEMWEEGEPRDIQQYKCAGLSIQSDDTLRLKVLNCDFTATSLCGIDSSDAYDEDTTTTTATPDSTTKTTTEEATTSTTEAATTSTTTTTAVPTTTTIEKQMTTTLPPTTTTEEKTTTTTRTPTTTTTTFEPTTSATTTTDVPTTTTTTEEPTTTTTTTTEEPTTTTTTEAPTSTTTEVPTTTTTTSVPETTSTTTAEPTTTTTTTAPTTTTTKPTTTTTMTPEPSTTTTTTTEPTTTEKPTTTTTTEKPTTTTTTEKPTTTTTTKKPTTTTTTTKAPTTTTTVVPTTTSTTEEPTTTTTTTTTTTETPTTTKEPTTTTSTTTKAPTTTTLEPTTRTTTTTTVEPTTTTTTTSTTTTTTTQAPTTTTTEEITTTSSSTTTEEPTTPGPKTGIFYNETGDYHYPNIVRNGTSIHDTYDIDVTNGPLGFGWAINLDKNLEGGKHCLKMNVRYKNGKDEECWNDPANCEEGLSASIWEKITFYRDDVEDRYIFSTGADGEGGQGIALYFRGIYFFVLVSTGDELWNLTAPGPVKNNTWNEIGIRWLKETGLELFINGARIAHVLYPDKGVSGGKRRGPVEFNIGCRKNQNGDYVDFAFGEYDEMTVWMWALAEEQEHFYLGGYDSNSTCDPELHPLRCETNIDKILENMGNAEIESADALTDALDHLKKLSEVQKDPPGSDNEDDENADHKYKEEVRTMVTIVEKLINMTWDKPDKLKVKDLENIMTSVQEISSNVLEEKYAAGWQDMTNEGISSIDFVNRVSSFQLHKASQTDSGKEPIKLNPNAPNIMTALQQSQLYGFLARDKPLTFPPEEEEEEKDYDEGDSKRKKRDTENADESTESEEEDVNTEPNVRFTVTKEVFGEIDRSEKVAFLGASYKKLHRISPLWNKKTGNETTLIFIDSEIVSASSNPEPSSANLQREPVTIILKHTRKVKASGRKLLADKDLQENGEIRKRECARWDENLQPRGTKIRGGWNTDSCSTANSTAEETTCQCTMLGTYAIISKIRQPFFIPEEEEWVKLTKWIGYGLSIILLTFYIIVITIRSSLHEEFHIIRLNLAIAALGALVSFLLRDFLYDDEDTCRIISILVHFFYVAVGTWLISEAHALFSALVNGSFGGKLLFYVMIGWILPAGMCGGCFSVIYNYGYDYRCLVGPTTGKRLLLVGPVIFAAMVAFTFSVLTCINYGTPAVKKTAIVNELSSATRYNFIVIILFLATWLFAVFAIVDLGFDSDEIPAFNPIFQIMNSFLGIFIVALTGFGSKYFRYCLCHSGRNRTETKTLNLDPFDVHDKANITNRKKIYAS